MLPTIIANITDIINDQIFMDKPLNISQISLPGVYTNGLLLSTNVQNDYITSSVYFYFHPKGSGAPPYSPGILPTNDPTCNKGIVTIVSDNIV